MPEEPLDEQSHRRQTEWRERAANTRKRKSEVAAINAALVLAQGRSFDDVSMDEVAAMAKVRVSTIYSRFGSKAGLAAAILGPSFALVAEAARRDIAAGLSGPDAVASFLDRLGIAVDENRSVANTFFVGMAQGPHHNLSQASDHPRNGTIDLPAALSEVLEAGHRRGELDIQGDAFEMSRTILNFFIARFLGEDESARDSASVVARLVLMGIVFRNQG